MPIKSLVQVTMELWGALFCVVCCIIIFAGRRADDARNKMLRYIFIGNIVLLVADSLAYIYRGNITNIGYYMVRITNLLVFLTYITISVLYVGYSGIMIEVAGNKYNKKWMYASSTLGIISMVVIGIARLCGKFYAFTENNEYYRTTGYSFFAGLLYSNILFVFIFIFWHRKAFRRKDYWSLATFIVIMGIITTVQNMFYGISFANITLVLISILLFLQYEIEMTGDTLNQLLELERQKANVAEKNAELAEYRAKVLLSQIQPHFLFNSLTAIKALIMKDQKNASKAVDHLAGFLRSSLDSLGHTGLVSIDQELKTTRDYLAMQKYRFGSKLEVEVISDGSTFNLPPFTIQPLVENAVHHGIRKKAGGHGKVSVRTSETETEHIIRVVDDGVGFNPDEAFDDGRDHYGMNIVRERLTQLCNGDLIITSEEGVGTTCTITVPKA